jgi:hemerythrin
MPFTWNENYGVGVKTFDDQHKRYIDLANQIDALSLQDGVSQEKILMSLIEFGNYAALHFSSEESYFEEYDYPEREPHIAEHNRYRETIKEFLVKAQSPNADVKKIAHDLSDFAIDWLLRHVISMDKHYTDFFHERGIK